MARALVLLLCWSCALRAPERLARFEVTRPAMGTEFRLVLYAEDQERAERAIADAFARIHALERALSDYDAGSELSCLSSRSDAGAPTEWLPLSADLHAVLAEAQALAGASGGAFDVTIGPYTQLWRRARRQGERPRPERLSEAALSVGHGKLELDGPGRRARLLAPQMRLDLGGIGKGFALDEALAVLARHGIERALLVGGGEMIASGPPPGEPGWRVHLVGLDGRGERVCLVRAALATSGDLEQALVLAGRRYSHILEPRTGTALSERRLVSVVGPRATRTDALATAVSVLGPTEGLRLLERYAGYEARVQVETAERIEERCSPGFRASVSCGAGGAQPRPPPQQPEAGTER